MSGEVWAYRVMGKYEGMEVGNVGSGVQRPPSPSRPQPRPLSRFKTTTFASKKL